MLKFKVILSKILNPNQTWSFKFKILASIIRKNFKISKQIRIMRKPEAPSFVGWGMTTRHASPWDLKSSSDITGLNFLETENSLLKLLRNGEFVTPSENSFKNMSGWRWRHYFLYWSASLATRFTKYS